MTPEARAALLLSYAHGPDLLQAALDRFTPESLDFQPGPGKWSIQTIVLHLAESEVAGYLRGRSIIAEPGTAILPFDQDRWAETMDVTAQPLGEAVALFRLLRELIARQLRALPESTWEHWAEHPERGRITLERWLEIYEGHLTVHLAQMERTFQAWGQTFPGT
jgi:hypothetical protein